MIYTGNICDGCGKVFEDGDDVIVCPECATAQHRECYEKNNRCVNAHLHKDGFVWKAQNTPSPKIKAEKMEEKAETFPCPNCGHHNPKGTRNCENCGMKLVVFGIDIADSMGENNPAVNNTPKTDIPRYEAPFTLGVGEGFEEDKTPAQTEESTYSEEVVNETPADSPVSPEQVQESLIRSIENSGPDFFVDGVHVNLLATLIGPNAYKYIEKFKKLELGKKISFNWAAFFFSSSWLFYRKLYKVGIIFVTISMMLSILVTPNIMEAMNALMQFFADMETSAAVMDEATVMAVMSEFLNKMAPVYIYGAAGFVMQLIVGFIANPIYKKYVLMSAKTVKTAKTKSEAATLVAKYGGVSVLAVLLAYFAQQLLSSIVSSLMFG